MGPNRGPEKRARLQNPAAVCPEVVDRHNWLGGPTRQLEPLGYSRLVAPVPATPLMRFGSRVGTGSDTYDDAFAVQQQGSDLTVRSPAGLPPAALRGRRARPPPGLRTGAAPPPARPARPLP